MTMATFKMKASPDFRKFERSLATAATWMPPIIGRHMRNLGRFAQDHMQAQIEHNNYTGALSRSTRWKYFPADTHLEINPTAMRGSHDGGLLMEFGTRPHRAPWSPIKQWADFRGLPAGAVWYKIKTRGTAAHPFVDETLQRAQGDIDDAGQYIVDDMADRVLGIKGETT